MQRRRWKRIQKRYHEHPRAALRAYLHYNGLRLSSLQRLSPAMIRRAVAFGYLGWARQIAEQVSGRDVLEVGCGGGLHAIGYAVVGVRSYLGLDPELTSSGSVAMNHRTRAMEDFGFSHAEISHRFPHLRFVEGAFDSWSPDATFDVAILHNVTEHLEEVDAALHRVWELLRPGGHLVFNHHNYYCWNGHHQIPQFVDQLDPGDERQRFFADWAHLDPEAMQIIDREKEASSRATWVNRIRLDVLRAATEKRFEVDRWTESAMDEDRGAGRLTAEIRARHPEYALRELTTQDVFCIARKKPSSRAG